MTSSTTTQNRPINADDTGCTAAVQQQVHPTASRQQPAGRTGLVDIHFSNISRTKCVVKLRIEETRKPSVMHSCSFFCDIRYTGSTEYYFFALLLRTTTAVFYV